jgi:hypothetical protein
MTTVLNLNYFKPILNFFENFIINIQKYMTIKNNFLIILIYKLKQAFI